MATKKFFDDDYVEEPEDLEEEEDVVDPDWQPGDPRNPEDLGESDCESDASSLSSASDDDEEEDVATAATAAAAAAAATASPDPTTAEKLAQKYTVWSAIKKKSIRHIFLNDFVLRMKEKYRLNQLQTNRALGLLHTALFFKAIWDREIHFSQGRIQSVDFFTFCDRQMICTVDLFRNHVPSRSGILAECKKVLSQLATEKKKETVATSSVLPVMHVQPKPTCRNVEKLWKIYLSKLE